MRLQLRVLELLRKNLGVKGVVGVSEGGRGKRFYLRRPYDAAARPALWEQVDLGGCLASASLSLLRWSRVGPG